MSDESVSKKPPEVESTTQSTIIDGASGELDREIALHLPPATDAELEAAMHSPTQATSPSLRRIARSRARSRQAWLLAALFAGFSCIALLWMSLFPSGSAGSGPEPRVSIESSRTAGALPLAVPAVQTATAPEQMPERTLEPARVEAEVPAAPSVASSPSAIEPTSEVAPSARGAVSNTSSSTPRVPTMPRPRLDKPSVPEEVVAPPRTRENAAAASSLSPAPAPSSKFVFQPQ